MMSIFAQALKILHESDLHHENRKIAQAAQLYVEWSLFIRLWTDWLEAETEQLRLLTEAFKEANEAMNAFNRVYEEAYETVKRKEETRRRSR